MMLVAVVASLATMTTTPGALLAQRVPPPRDTLSTAQREELRRVSREASEMNRARVRNDTAARRALARASEPTAFADSGARQLLNRARVAREQQDSALRSYSATTTQRISASMGVRKVGLEKLLWRGDNVAKVEWKRGVGVWITPVGSRMTIPMADQVRDDGFSSAVTVPYFPGKESLWLPDGGVAKTDINEREIIHPIARGAEAYYRYATGDSLTIKLADGKAIRIRELRISARKPDWHQIVGSFWFDVDGGQLVRAAYRLAVDMDIWSMVSEEIDLERLDDVKVAVLRDSIARATLDRETYVKDSTRRADAARSGRGNAGEDGPPGWVKAGFRPAKAKLDGVSVEYGLYQGRFWLPKAHSATASAQVGFIRVPITFDEKFTYESVDGDLSLPALPMSVSARVRADSVARGLKVDTTVKIAAIPAPVLPDTGRVVIITDNNSANSTVCMGGCRTMTPAQIDSMKRATLERVRKNRDSALAVAKTSADSLRITTRFNSRRDVQCQSDSTWIRTETRYDGALRMAYRMPCDENKLANAKELPTAYASDEELFDVQSRDELLSSLDLSLQPAWAPQRPQLRSGFDLMRYNRVEGLSVGLEATQVLGAGYSLRALGRIGHADLHANGELILERSNGKRTAFASVFHRLAAVNPEWGGALTLAPSLPAFLYTRDEGFYYRTYGIELGERIEQRRGAFEWRLFVERQYSAADTGVVNTFSFAGLFGERRFRPNIQSEESSFTGIAGTWQQSYGNNPTGFRLTTAIRGELATGTREYGRASIEGTLTRPLGKLIGSVSASAGSSVGTVPSQRLWWMGGLKSVRGQLAGTQDGDQFWLLRTEIGRRSGFFRPVGFFDIGASGSRKNFGNVFTQRGAGFGFSLFDGLFRMDVSRGIFPFKRWRTDLYLEAPI
ncbi:MAG: hypothetical protein H7Z40_08260 [Phycisphaerae bacterium]|nr:hypothetical protein [Gemmatimonadaceae bacterium]